MRRDRLATVQVVVAIARRVALSSALLLAACAHERTPPVEPPDDGSARLARENAALRRRIEMLEDRVLHLEQSADGSAPAYGEGPSDGRRLPIVRLAREREREPESVPRPADPPTPARTGKTIGTMPSPAADADWPPEEPTDRSDGAGDEDGPGRSYRLVGSRLVELTQPGTPKGPDQPLASKGSKTIAGQYEAAMAAYKSGELQSAQEAFDAFAKAHPRHAYADNALYWKGEAAYDQARFADALAAFTEVVERYAGGNKAADALLKIGLCYRELGDTDNARDVLTQLIDAYPRERASDIARVKLAEFGIPG